jgi:hypothetical protein
VEGWTRNGNRSSSHRSQASLAPPVDFCNHCGSPAQLRSDRPPRELRMSFLARSIAGGLAPEGCKAGRACPEQGPKRAIAFSSASSCDCSRRSFTPSQTSRTPHCRESTPLQVGEPSTGKERIPANPPPDGAHSTPSVQRAATHVTPRSLTCAAHPRCLPSAGSLMADIGLPRLFTACGVPGVVPCYHRAG